jgi:hypothetical protein
MREICQSGSMSGDSKQDQAKPDCGGATKAQSNNHRETTVTAPVLDSTRRFPRRKGCATQDEENQIESSMTKDDCAQYVRTITALGESHLNALEI